MVLGDLEGNLYSAIAYRESGVDLCHRGNQTYEVVRFIKGRSQVVRPLLPEPHRHFLSMVRRLTSDPGFVTNLLFGKSGHLSGLSFLFCNMIFTECLLCATVLGIRIEARTK